MGERRGRGGEGAMSNGRCTHVPRIRICIASPLYVCDVQHAYKKCSHLHRWNDIFYKSARQGKMDPFVFCLYTYNKKYV